MVNVCDAITAKIVSEAPGVTALATARTSHLSSSCSLVVTDYSTHQSILQACAPQLYRSQYPKVCKGYYVGYRTEVFDAFMLHLISIHELIFGGTADDNNIG